jgi:FkbM family methyltransferase
MLQEQKRGEYLFDYGARPTTVLDLGANVGAAARWFLATYPGCAVWAVEPDPNSFVLLSRNLAQWPSSVVVRTAVSETGGIVEIASGANGSAGNFVRSIRLEAVEDVGGGTGFDVTATTVSSLLALLPDGCTDVLKIDIEGSEVEILSQAGLWFDRVRHVVVESHERHRPGCEAAIMALEEWFDLAERRGDVFHFSRLADRTARSPA